MDLAALQAKAAASNPMGVGVAPILRGRVLYLDGDGLAYYCAGNDETTLGEARARLKDKIDSMMRGSQAERVVILLTGSGGHKGHRYAIARVKPYQGQRSSSKRPKNWTGLRILLENSQFGETIIDYDREADDRFGQFGWADPVNTVIGTQDKDMRMVPGWHIDWKDNRMFYLEPGTYEATFNDKLFGEKWFWMQMLHGDTADFIPGLPKTGFDGKLKLIGEKTAATYLSQTSTSEEAFNLVYLAYASYYKERAFVEMAEQAVMLWMRASSNAAWDEALVAGPLMHARGMPQYDAAYLELNDRVTEASRINDLSTQGE